MNKSQENWSDAQFSLSTATPSLGGAAPKLTTLKVNSRQYRTTPRSPMLSWGSGTSPMHVSSMSRARNVTEMRDMTSLNIGTAWGDDEEDPLRNISNALETQAEMTFSSTNFIISRRSSIDADVSIYYCSSLHTDFSLNFYIIERVNHIN